MRRVRGAFTLIEVLVSISLLSLVLLALYNSVGMLQKSNTQLFGYLEKAEREKQGAETLFLDIAGSDGNLTIKGESFSRLCLERSVNSLYELSAAKICWFVAKKGTILLRSEGNGYSLPLKSGSHVAVDAVMEDLDLFRVYRQKSALLVVLRQKGKEAVSFIVRGVPDPAAKKKKKGAKSKRKSGGKSSPATPAGTPMGKPPRH